MQDFWRLPMPDVPDPDADTTTEDVASGEKGNDMPTTPTGALYPGPAGLFKEIQEGRGPAQEETTAATAKEAAESTKGGRWGSPQKAMAEDKEAKAMKNGTEKRGWRGKGWRDFTAEIPERPAVPESTPKQLEQIAVEEQQLKARDQLRNAVSAEEMRSAIAEAEKLGLVQEVQVGRKKLAKMEA
mmetsp:Transcript_40732/g.74340  ORF Transcript_40732/g.74340 Transcript_40732/m.74340 type:complete len:185 (-) Transcript_40732:47-601(-)